MVKTISSKPSRKLLVDLMMKYAGESKDLQDRVHTIRTAKELAKSQG